MKPTTTSENLTVLDTGKIDGGAYRWVKLADGSGRVEKWRGNKWTPGGASFGEFLNSPPVSAGFASELGIPPKDLMTEREKPNTATAPPRKRDNEKFLREAIRLATEWAEEDALRMLAMKTKQIAEHDRHRKKLVHMLKERAWDLAASSVPPGHA
jgi:hypothetical protein